MSEAQTAIILTGSFTLGGVLLTAITSGIGAIFRARWARTALAEETRLRAESELRNEKQREFVALLHLQTTVVNAYMRLSEKVRIGEIASADILGGRTFIEQAGGVDELEHQMLSIELVSGRPLTNVMRALDDELIDMFAPAMRGEEIDSRTFHDLRLQQLAQMRTELDLR